MSIIPRSESDHITMSWANLPKDILCLIISLLNLAEVANVAAVCAPWRWAVMQFAMDGSLSARQLPWIVMSERPEARAAALLRPLGSPIANARRRCCGVHGHWLAIADDVGSLYLFHPLFRTCIELPPKYTLPVYTSRALAPFFYLNPYFVRKVVLSSPPTEAGCRAAIIFGRDEVAISNLGDSRWTAFTCEPGIGQVFYQDIVFHNGELVAVDTTETAWEFRFESGRLTRSMLCQISWDPFLPLYLPNYISLKHLLVVDDRLIMVVRERSYVYDEQNCAAVVRTTGFRVLVLMNFLSRKRWFTVNSIGNYATFLGRSISVAVEAGLDTDRRFFADCIYFTEPDVMRADRMQDVGWFRLPYGPLLFENGDPNWLRSVPLFSWMFNYGVLF